MSCCWMSSHATCSSTSASTSTSTGLLIWITVGSTTRNTGVSRGRLFANPHTIHILLKRIWNSILRLLLLWVLLLLILLLILLLLRRRRSSLSLRWWTTILTRMWNRMLTLTLTTTHNLSTLIHCRRTMRLRTRLFSRSPRTRSLLESRLLTKILIRPSLSRSILRLNTGQSRCSRNTSRRIPSLDIRRLLSWFNNGCFRWRWGPTLSSGSGS